MRVEGRRRFVGRVRPYPISPWITHAALARLQPSCQSGDQGWEATGKVGLRAARATIARRSSRMAFELLSNRSWRSYHRSKGPPRCAPRCCAHQWSQGLFHSGVFHRVFAMLCGFCMPCKLTSRDFSALHRSAEFRLLNYPILLRLLGLQPSKPSRNSWPAPVGRTVIEAPVSRNRQGPVKAKERESTRRTFRPPCLGRMVPANGRSTAITWAPPVHLTQHYNLVEARGRDCADIDDPKELDPRQLILGRRVSRGQLAALDDPLVRGRAHLPNTDRIAVRARAVGRGSELPDASRISSSHSRSLALTGVPRISTSAFAAVEPTSCSRARRIR